MSVTGEIVHGSGSASANSWTSDVIRERQHLHWFHLIYTSDATVGNRQIRAELLDIDDNIVYDISAGAVQAASLAYHYNYLPGIYRETSFINGEIQVPFPMFLVVPATYKLRIRDVNNVSSGDSISVTWSAEKV